MVLSVIGAEIGLIVDGTDGGVVGGVGGLEDHKIKTWLMWKKSRG